MKYTSITCENQFPCFSSNFPIPFFCISYRMNSSMSYGLLLFSITLWCALILTPPIVAHIESPSAEISHHLYKFFSPICHQHDSRSLHLSGFKLAVCARCSGIYFGFFLGALLFPVVSIRRGYSATTLWIFFIVPMLVDVLMNIFGIHHSSVFTRIVTGLFFGVGAANILTPIMTEAIQEIISPFKHNQGVHHEPKT